MTLGTRLEAIVKRLATETADRENSCSGCNASYGSETWKDYAEEKRALILEIVAAFLADSERR